MARGAGKWLQQVKLISRDLSYKSPDGSCREHTRIPFGIEINTTEFRFQKLVHSDTLEIRAQFRSDEKTTRCTIVSPGYTAKDHVTDPETGKRIEVDLWTVYNDRDRLATREVIQRVHYLSDSGRGMLLACAMSNPDEQTLLRRRRRKKYEDSKEVSWFLPCGGIIACGVVSRLWHGNPVAGRRLIANQLKLKDGWESLKRDAILQKMRIAWASRFAVDLPYQGLGLGTVVARHLKKIARHYHAPSADFLEVITTTAKEAAIPISKDFLVRAGYHKLDTPMKSGSLMVMNESGFRIPKPAIKNYYYVDIRNEPI